MKPGFRNASRAFAIGGLFGAVGTTWFSPRLIAWYFEPPVPVGVSCRASIESALERLQWMQIIGLAIGGALGFIIYRAFRKPESSLETL